MAVYSGLVFILFAILTLNNRSSEISKSLLPTTWIYNIFLDILFKTPVNIYPLYKRILLKKSKYVCDPIAFAFATQLRLRLRPGVDVR